MKKEVQNELETMEAFYLLSNKQEQRQAFHVPNQYFIELKKQLIQIPNQKKQFQIPEGYFESLNQKVMDKVDALEQDHLEKETKSKIFDLRPYITIAASLALFVTAFYFLQQSKNSESYADYQELYEDGSIDALELAFVTDDAETYVLESLFNDFDSPDSGDSSNSLFEDLEEDNLFDDLFEIDDLNEVS